MNSLPCVFCVLALVSPALLMAQEAPAVETFLLDPVDEKRSRAVPLKVYRQTESKLQPVVLFSHGLGGSRENNAYLGKEWARHGYTAIFMQHLGSDEAVWKSVERSQRFVAMKQAASLKSSLDRFADVPFVIDQLEKWNAEEGHRLFDTLNLEHIGLSGHSFGAVTSQALMGQKFPLDYNFADPRIDAFIPMSPSPGKGMNPVDAFGHILSPVLCMTGTNDTSAIQADLKPEARQEVYAALPESDKFQLVFENGSHMAFSESSFRNEKRIPHHHPAIQRVTTLFWNAYLRNDEEAQALLQSDQFRDTGKLVAKDVWEWK
ncbi:MAG: acetylhydrolase [Verrucomicrobiota bacterium]